MAAFGSGRGSGLGCGADSGSDSGSGSQAASSGRSRSGVRERPADGSLRREMRGLRVADLRSVGPVDGPCRHDAGEHAERLADSRALLPLSSESAHASRERRVDRSPDGVPRGTRQVRPDCLPDYGGEGSNAYRQSLRPCPAPTPCPTTDVVRDLSSPSQDVESLCLRLAAERHQQPQSPPPMH